MSQPVLTLEESLHKILECPKQDLGDAFYKRLFQRCPEARAFFTNVDLEVQANTLVNVLHIIVSHASHRYPATTAYLKFLGNKHQVRKIPLDLYTHFSQTLLDVLAEFHGDQWTSDLRTKWNDALTITVAAMLPGYVGQKLTY
jgi:hemoglobin-like flavoprotein